MLLMMLLRHFNVCMYIYTQALLVTSLTGNWGPAIGTTGTNVVAISDSRNPCFNRE